MKIDAVSTNNYSQNKLNNTSNFTATLPKIGAIPVKHDGWDRVYLTCQKQKQLPELKKTLQKLKEAGEGVLGCVWKKHEDYPSFFSAKDSEELGQKMKPILDAYTPKDSVSSVSILQKSKNIVAETFDVRMHSEIETDILITEASNSNENVCESILKTLKDIATPGTAKNKVLFSGEVDEFFRSFRE